MSVPSSPEQSAPSVVALQEQLVLVGREWVAYDRLLVRRRIVTETVQLTATVSREELIIERPSPAEAADLPPSAAAAPLVWVLNRQVPTVTISTEPYEKVTVRVLQLTGEQAITADLASERIEVVGDGGS